MSGPGTALAGLAVRQVRRGALLVALITGAMSAVVAWQYASTFAGALDAGAVRALAANPAIRALFGAPLALDSPGGFAVWRTGTPFAVLVGAWALSASTRITRGEEDAGRWNLLLCGRIRRHDAVGAGMAAVGAGAVLAGAGVAVGLVLAGTRPAGAFVHGAGIAGIGLVFAAVGALAGQLLPTRAAASGASAAVLGAGLLVRMVADGVPELGWLRWVSPLGLVAESRPYAGDRAAPLLVLAVFPVVLGGAALWVAQHRDLGAGALVSRAGDRKPRTLLLNSAAAFAARRSLRAWLGWAGGIGAFFALIGALTGSIIAFLAGSPRFAELAAAAGFGGLGSAPGFAATMFSLLGIPSGMFAATRVGALAAEETTRCGVALFALPLSRRRIAVVELAVVGAGVLALHVVAGLAMWAGAAIAGAPLGAGEALAGAVNVVPIGLLSLGAGVLALGWAPRAVVAVGALPTAGGFLLDVLARSAQAPEWVVELSPFAHLGAVPLDGPVWTDVVGLVLCGAGLGAAGVSGVARRDLRC